jgi:hypothetical protein
MNYTGNYLEFGVGLTCNYCEPSWVCNGYGICSQNGTQNCNSVLDIYDCFSLTNQTSDLYSGNYSEFTPAGCSVPPITGYVPAYGSGDLANITIDALAQAVLEVIALIGVIVIVALVVFAANRLKRIGGK